MKSIKITSMISFLIAFSMLIYAIRGKFGALIITLLILFLLFQKKRRNYVTALDNLYCIFLVMFAVIMNIFRTLTLEYYLIIGYLAASIICVNSNINNYNSLWDFLRRISIFEAFGVYLQWIAPNLYYQIMSLVLPDSVVLSIQKRFLDGYYAGFSREVSYTMFFIVLGLGIYLFYWNERKSNNINMKVKRIAGIIFLFGALFISGKRATLIFFIFSALITQFLKSNDKLKILKYLLIVLIILFVVWNTRFYWLQIPALSRLGDLVEFIEARDLVGVTNGRISIYENAINLWKSNKLIGIGWGNFKYSTSQNVWYAGFDVHNCYLQVLCEIGLIGFIWFCILTFISIIRAIKAVIKSRGKNSINKLAVLSAYIQIFFLLYSFTEPILYEYTDYIIYFVCINISGLIIKEISDKKRWKRVNVEGVYIE